jgi:peptidoglycan/LPS O-acetylase OafA/YrhL
MVRSTGRGAPSQTLAQFKIILFALAAGVLMFAVVASVLGPVGGPAEEGADDSLGQTLLYALGAMALGVLPLAVVLRRWGFSRVEHRREEAIAEIDDGRIPQELAGAILVSAAAVESVGLFGCVVVLITGNMIALAAPAVAVVGILMSVPSEESLRAGVESSGRVA